MNELENLGQVTSFLWTASGCICNMSVIMLSPWGSLIYNNMCIFIVSENYINLRLRIRNANSNKTVFLERKVPFLSGKQVHLKQLRLNVTIIIIEVFISCCGSPREWCPRAAEGMLLFLIFKGTIWVVLHKYSEGKKRRKSTFIWHLLNARHRMYPISFPFSSTHLCFSFNPYTVYGIKKMMSLFCR